MPWPCLGKTQSLSSVQRWLVPLLGWVQSTSLCWVLSDLHEWPSTRWLFQRAAQPPHFKRSRVKANSHHLQAENGKQIQWLYSVSVRNIIGIMINYSNPPPTLLPSTYFIEYTLPASAASNRRDLSQNGNCSVTRVASRKNIGGSMNCQFFIYIFIKKIHEKQIPRNTESYELWSLWTCAPLNFQWWSLTTSQWFLFTSVQLQLKHGQKLTWYLTFIQETATKEKWVCLD